LGDVYFCDGKLIDYYRGAWGHTYNIRAARGCLGDVYFCDGKLIDILLYVSYYICVEELCMFWEIYIFEMESCLDLYLCCGRPMLCIVYYILLWKVVCV
jgi:hypothetical protein